MLTKAFGIRKGSDASTRGDPQWEWDRREAEDNGNISEDNRDER